LPLGFTANFYGAQRSRVYVNNNGNVTFDAPLSNYTPFPLAAVNREIIAPFFADVDTRAARSGVVRYGYGSVVFEGRPAFCATWENVGYYLRGDDKLNSFQLLLVDRGDRAPGDFDIVFNYDQILWETGDADGGVGGLGGTPARAGFSNGTGLPGTSFEVPGSGSSGAFLDSAADGLVHRSVGGSAAGRQIYTIRAGRPTDQFVYVALGDSYSSGEGAPPFENGYNYPYSLPQENTLTGRNNGNGCHRSLINYAKLNTPLFEPGQSAVLVDRTCSGALIEPPANSSKAPIAGYETGRTTQVDEALGRLDSGYNLSGGDVDLVTMSAGGNDAKFGGIVAACLLPTFMRALFEAYPDFPANVEYILTRFGTCENLDQWVFKSGEALETLPSKLSTARFEVLDKFPNSQLLQLTYPSIVPPAGTFGGDSCGGIRHADANYARSRVAAINEVIRNPGIVEDVYPARLQIVDLEKSFGSNPLCGSDPLAHGIDRERLQATLQELLEPGSAPKSLLNAVVNAYNIFEDCVENLGYYPGINLLCGFKADEVVRRVEELRNYFLEGDRLDDLVGSLVEGPDAVTRYENSRHLFHPNADGFEVMACEVLDTYRLGYSSGGCQPGAVGNLKYVWNGSPLTRMSPIVVTPGSRVPVQFNGFDGGSRVTVTYRSDPISGPSLTADAAGEISDVITIPAELPPGIHRVVFDGTSHGTPRSIEVLIKVEGRPVGGTTYAAYLEGFTPGEHVRVVYGDLEWATMTANQDGGIVVDVPLPDPAVPLSVTISATGLGSGAARADTITPQPSSAAIWATGETGAVSIAGNVTATGLVHSEGGITLTGSSTLQAGGEYGTTLTVQGNARLTPPAVKLTLADTAPVQLNAAAWRPGGGAQTAPSYRQIPTSACRQGSWTLSAAEIAGAAVVYVPCAVQITGPATTITATIVSEKTITVSGAAKTFSPANGAPALVSLAAAGATGLSVRGAGHRFAGPVLAAGAVDVAGGGSTFECGVYADAVTATGGSAFAACPKP
jgi:hypothetical protein